MALTKGSPRDRRVGNVRQLGVLAGVAFFQGGLAIAVAGYLRPGRGGQGADNTAKAADAATYRVVGVFRYSGMGGTTDGAVVTDIENEGWYLFKNGTSGDALTIADLENDVFVIDDETVGKTNPNSTRVKAGVLKDVTAEGVWVKLTK